VLKTAIDLQALRFYLDAMKTTLLITCLAALGGTPAVAASSPWFQTEGARIRLVSMPSPDSGAIEAGLQFELEPGWKTYWRTPGASGLPPQINFLGSENVEKTEMILPTPTRFADGGGMSAGYKKAVTFPIKVKAVLEGRPLTLKANGLVGICGTICVPVQFKLELTETGNRAVPGDVARALFDAAQSITKPFHDEQHMQKVTYDADGQTLFATAKVPAGTDKADLFVEGPFNWYLSPISASKIDGQTAEFSIPLRDLPKDAKPEHVSLRFTLVADGKGVEQKMTPRRR